MKTIISILMILVTFGMNAQKTYLKITKDNHSTSYPPGTQFDLKNSDGYIILKYSETPRIQEIDGDYQLIVSPDWKNEKDIFKLVKGDKVELVKTSNFERSSYETKGFLNTNSVKVHKTVTDSQTFSGKKNLRLELDNGLLFVYRDGEFYAKLDDEYVDIQNKYVIETKKGTLKVSFNPNSGVTWWVFEEVSGQ